MPIPTDKQGLLDVLDDIRQHIEDDDSFEGSFEYLMPGPDDPQDAQFMFRCAYRVGNRHGQGGYRMMG